MKKHIKFWIVAIVVAINLMMQPATAQIPDDTNGWLYRLCKTWGYVKYFSQQKCGAPWDDLLNTTINQVLESDNNADYNTAIMDMMDQVGNNRPVTDQGVLPDTNLLVNTEWINDQVFSPAVKGFLSTFSSNIYPDQSTCFVKFNNGSNPDSYGLIDFTQDRFSLTIDYTIESNRLTVIFYYWNVINYFFPYRNLMDQSWDSTLLEFIPIFRNSRNEVEFHINFLKLVTRINDSHGTTYSPIITENFWKGSYMPKVCFDRIDNQCVVYKVNGIEEIEPGDVLIEINGQSIKIIEDSLANYIPSSNQAGFYRILYQNMIRGGENTEIELTLINQQGQTYTKTTNREILGAYWNEWRRESNIEGTFRITTCGYGYVNMGKLLPSEVAAMYDSLKSAPAIIFDLRFYPKQTVWTLGQYFFKGPITSALFYCPALFGLMDTKNFNYMPGWYYEITGGANLGSWYNPDPYPGKVYILVNEETMSQAEYTCQHLSYHLNAKVIGNQTVGSDGDVTRITLPGGIVTSFTSLGLYYADGYQQQRNGVKIDSVVAPTIQGIREGKDEILLAALDCISGIDRPDAQNLKVKVYPNPVITGSVKVHLSLDQDSEITLSVMDLTGKIIEQEVRYCPAGDQTLELGLSSIAPGLYILETRSWWNTAITKLVIR